MKDDQRPAADKEGVIISVDVDLVETRAHPPRDPEGDAAQAYLAQQIELEKQKMNQKF